MSRTDNGSSEEFEFVTDLFNTGLMAHLLLRVRELPEHRKVSAWKLMREFKGSQAKLTRVGTVAEAEAKLNEWLEASQGLARLQSGEQYLMEGWLIHCSPPLPPPYDDGLMSIAVLRKSGSENPPEMTEVRSLYMQYNGGHMYTLIEIEEASKRLYLPAIPAEDERVSRRGDPVEPRGYVNIAIRALEADLAWSQNPIGYRWELFGTAPVQFVELGLRPIAQALVQSMNDVLFETTSALEPEWFQLLIFAKIEESKNGFTVTVPKPDAESPWQARINIYRQSWQSGRDEYARIVVSAVVASCQRIEGKRREVGDPIPDGVLAASAELAGLKLLESLGLSRVQP